MTTQICESLPIIPKHIAIIMDGNNRFGKSKQLATGAGHVAGKDALDPIVEHCLALGVEVLTVFAFSSENWARPKDEVDLLMRLLSQTIYEQLPRMNQHRIRLRFIGDRSQIDGDLVKLMAQAEAKTADFDAMTLVIAISYGGQWDFLLWQTAYAELFFTPTLWPEFGCDELDEMIRIFAGRERRFGMTSEQIQKT